MIRGYEDDDRAEWLRLRRLLWWDCPLKQHETEAQEIIESHVERVFLAHRPGGGLRGFAEASIRPWAIGCDPGPVGYLEGWFVDEDARRQGVGQALIAAVEAWVRSRGCRQLASDAELGNDVSHQAHEAIGFGETVRLVLYKKDLAGPAGGV